jgi:hypothetical protein
MKVQEGAAHRVDGLPNPGDSGIPIEPMRRLDSVGYRCVGLTLNQRLTVFLTVSAFVDQKRSTIATQ